MVNRVYEGGYRYIGFSEEESFQPLSEGVEIGDSSNIIREVIRNFRDMHLGNTRAKLICGFIHMQWNKLRNVKHTEK